MLRRPAIRRARFVQLDASAAPYDPTKVALAMSRTVGTHTFVLIEEPENHLSHTSLQRLIARIEEIADDEQQVFVTTHNSFVLNRLGLDKLTLLHNSNYATISNLSADTVDYFRKLANYDTLRLVTARMLVLVEGPSDAIVFQRAFIDTHGVAPEDRNVDIVSMSGLTFARALELCHALDRDAIALQDNDGNTKAEVLAPVEKYLATGKREMLVGDKENGHTLEPQILNANQEELLRKVLKVTAAADLQKWMPNNKTEGALRILDSPDKIAYPDYIQAAVDRFA